MRFDFIYFDSGGTLYDLSVKTEKSPGYVASQNVQRVHGLLTGMGINSEFTSLQQSVARQIKPCQQRWGEAYTFVRLMEAVIEDLQLALGAEEAACLADAYAGPRYASWLFPGTKQALSTLHKSGYRLGIIANTTWPGFCMDRAFTGVGLLPLFSVRVYSGDIGIAKPDPDIFRLAERAVGLEGKRILYVGNDVENDIKGAAAAGWSTAFRRAGQATTAGLADMEFDHISELVDYCLD